MQKEYDHEEDRDSDSVNSLHNEQYQKLEEEYNFAKITADVNELAMQFKSQDQSLRQVNKEVGTKVSESQLSEVLALINSGIQSDPNVTKLLKTKEQSEEVESKNKIKVNSLAFSRKLNQMSEALGILLSSIRKLQAKVTTVQSDLSSQLTERVSNIQSQVQESRSEQVKENMQLQQKMEMLSFELGDRMRDIETKNSWKLTQFKAKIDEKISEEFVRTYLENVEAKLDKKMRQFQVKSNIDPERIDKLEQDITLNNNTTLKALTECQYQLATLRDEFQEKAVKKGTFEEELLKIQKRLHLFNTNFDQVYQRVKTTEEREGAMGVSITKLLKDSDQTMKEVSRINTVLNNLKIGQDFQRMLAEMNPTKVLELQDKVEEVHHQQGGIFREIQAAKREIQKVNAKTEVMGIMAPNQLRQKFKKQELEEALSSFLEDHHFSQKIANIDRQLNQYKLSVDAINLLTRQVARIQKEDASHHLQAEIRNVQEMVKRELKFIHQSIRDKARVDSDKDRPASKGVSITSEVVPMGDNFQNRSFSMRKLSKGLPSGPPSQSISTIRVNLGKQKL